MLNSASNAPSPWFFDAVCFFFTPVFVVRVLVVGLSVYCCTPYVSSCCFHENAATLCYCGGFLTLSAVITLINFSRDAWGPGTGSLDVPVKFISRGPMNRNKYVVFLLFFWCSKRSCA